MIRTTYRGRTIKVLAVRGKPYQRKLIINGGLNSLTPVGRVRT